MNTTIIFMNTKYYECLGSDLTVPLAATLVGVRSRKITSSVSKHTLALISKTAQYR
jgi:hypothetical protein